MVDVKVTVEKSAEIDTRLRAYGTMLRDFKPFLGAEYLRLRAVLKERFDTEGGDMGGWKTLNPKYVEWKRARFGNTAIGVMSGRMRASLVYGGSGEVAEVSAFELKFGTKVTTEAGFGYPAQFHKFRPLLGMRDEERAAMALRLREYIVKTVEG